MRANATILPLRVDRLSYISNGQTILREVDLLIREGPPTLVIGPNGAGKSVLLRLLHGLLEPTSGRISWSSLADPRSRQAMVFQRPALLRRSVRANVVYPLALAGLPRAERADRVDAALELVGLTALAGRAARGLSGGEQQRLALARAAALHPALLFLDEPCASLDPAATRAVETIVTRLAAAGTKIVMTTHDLGQARRLAGDAAFLHRGRLLEQGPAAAFFTTPRTPEAAAFLRGELVW